MVQFNEGSATYASLLAKYKSAGVDTVLSTTSKETTAELLRKMDELHFEGRLLSPDLIDTIGEKLYGPTSAHMNAYSVHPVTNNEFPIAFEKHFNRKPRKYADSAYDSLMSLVEAVTVAGDNPEEVKNYFEKTIRRSGAAGLITFTSNHDVAGRGYEIVKLVTKKEG